MVERKCLQGYNKGKHILGRTEMIGDITFFIFGVLIFVLVIMLLIYEHKNLKVFALITPAIISIIIFGALFIKEPIYKGIDVISVGLAILGIVVSVWVGLNIYNVLEKDEVEKMLKDNEKFKNDYKKEYKETINYILKSTEKYQNDLKRFIIPVNAITIKYDNKENLDKDDLINEIGSTIRNYCRNKSILIDITERKNKKYFLYLELRSTTELNDSALISELNEIIQDDIKHKYPTYDIKVGFDTLF